jgi:hypothetical protein
MVCAPSTRLTPQHMARLVHHCSSGTLGALGEELLVSGCVCGCAKAGSHGADKTTTCMVTLCTDIVRMRTNKGRATQDAGHDTAGLE